MRCMIVLALAVGCGADQPITGTLVYSERDTRNIRLLDLETGSSRLVDGGRFGSVSMAPDAMHVAYEGADRIMKVADRTGTITPILPGGGCAGEAEWLASTSLAYCISSSTYSGMMFLPSLDGASPRFVYSSPVISPDGTLVAYINAGGDLITERIDGSDTRVLVPSKDPTAMYPLRNVTAFTPDQQRVIVLDYSGYPPKLQIVALADGTTITVDDAFVGGTAGGTPVFRGASSFSPDGSELVVQSSTALIAVSLATGATRPLAAFADRVSSAGAVFLDSARVLWVRVDDHSMSDIGSYTLSLHVAGSGPSDDLILEPSDSANVEWRSIGVSSEGFVAVPGEALVIALDGTVLVRNDTVQADDIIGVTPDNAGFIVHSFDGTVRYVEAHGAMRELATTADANGEFLEPYAAYRPVSGP